MFGDANSTSALGGVHLVVLGVLGFSIAATLGLFLLGLPRELVGVAFVVIVVASLYLARPLLRRFAPQFDSVENE